MLTLKSRYGEIIKPSIKLVISLVLLGVISVIAINVLQLIPGFFELTAFTEMGMGLIAITLVLFFGQHIANGIRNAWKSNPELFELTYNLIQVLAVAIAYVAFQRVIEIVFPSWNWAYSVTLLAIALIPGIRAGITLVSSIDKWFDRKG